MNYSIDLAYLDYFKNVSAELHNSAPIEDRLKVTGLAAGTALVGGVRTVGRVVKLVIKIAKVIFYSLASLFTLGDYDNLNRLKSHCKLLTLNIAALIGLPLQVVVHSLAIAIGVISPKAAYQTMQIGTTPLAWITSCENGVWQQYKTPKSYTKVVEALISKIGNIFNPYSPIIRLAMKAILSEFSCALDAALMSPLGYMDPFHSFGANPKTLTDEQKKLTPILLLNGNYSHQGTFLPLLHALKSSNNQRPIYTINLPPNTTQFSFIQSKIETIKDQYGKTSEDQLEIDIIGHSMGSSLIQNICASDKKQIRIRRVITVGTPFFSRARAENISEAPFDIIGTKDCLNQQSKLQQHQIKTIKTGHLGLLFHYKSLNAMVGLLA